MKFLKLCVLVGMVAMIGCSSENIRNENPISSLSSEKNQNIFSFKSWEEFYEKYHEFSTISDLQELELRTDFSINKNSNLSPALNALLNNGNEVMIEGKIIWYNQGTFFETSSKSQKTSEELKPVGEVRTSKVDLNTSSSKKATSSIGTTLSLNNDTENYQWRFWKQRYVENCGSGKVQGTSSKEFKYVNEIYSEYLRFGYQHNYSLYLRVKLEYNYDPPKWRASGEGREISINVTDRSTLQANGYVYPDQSSNSTPYNINFNSYCSSDQNILLRWYYDINPVAYGTTWKVDLEGQITQKMVGDVESNRWTNYIDF